MLHAAAKRAVSDRGGLGEPNPPADGAAEAARRLANGLTGDEAKPDAEAAIGDDVRGPWALTSGRTSAMKRQFSSSLAGS
jgi:hypothetical protein